MSLIMPLHVCQLVLTLIVGAFAQIIIVIIIIIMVIFRCYFSREHKALSYRKLCEHRIRKNEQIECTVHGEKSYLKQNKLCVNEPRQSMKQKAFAKVNRKQEHCANKQH